MDEKREFLRHTLATLAYRASKALRGAPDDFGNTRAIPTGRSAAEILAHIGDLLDWALTAVKGQAVWKATTPKLWPAEVDRFYKALRSLDEPLASEIPLANSPDKLFQGPIADALTHVGQLATLRRIAGAPVRGESYFKADIVVGKIGPDQTPAAFEFD